LFGNNTYVSVGYSTTNYYTTTSLTGTQTTRTNPSTNLISAAIFANNLFVICTIGGVIRTSPDAITWSLQITNTTQQINRLVYQNGTFVAVCAGGIIRTSTSGTGTWSSATSGTTNVLNDVTYVTSLGLWVAVGASGTIVTSTDAGTWTVRTSGVSTNLREIEYQDSTFVVFGDFDVVLTSTNGTAWTIRKQGMQQPRSFDYGNDVWCGVGTAGEIVTSSDLLNWTFRTSGTTSQLNRVVYRNNTWVVVGTGGLIRTSADTITWTIRTSNTSATFNDVEYSSVANLWAAVGVTGLYRTAPATNLSSWTGGATTPSSTLTGLAYSAARNKFIAVSTVGNIYNIALSNQSLQSTYIINNGDNQFSNNPITNGLYSVAAGTFSTDTFNTIWMACGSGGIIRYSQTPTNTSSLPVAWRSTTSGTTNALQKIVYGNGIFVAVGVSGK